MTLYCNCFPLGYCRNRQSRIVGNRDLANPDFVRDVHDFALALRIPCDAWLDKLTDHYRDLPGCVVDQSGQEVEIDMGCFETDGIRYWFRDWVNTPWSVDYMPKLRAESKPRVIALATILRATYPAESILWGIRAANDNDVPPTYQPPRCGSH